MENIDKGLTVPKCAMIVTRPKIPPNVPEFICPRMYQLKSSGFQ